MEMKCPNKAFGEAAPKEHSYYEDVVNTPYSYFEDVVNTPY